MSLPWYALSPSPFTVVYWIVLASWAAIFRLNVQTYKRFQMFARFTDALFIVGLVVVSNDIIWVFACLFKWGALYPASVPQLGFCVARNVAAVMFCYLLTFHLFKKRVVGFTKATWLLYGVNVLFMSVWFWLAPTPAFTDWTYAIRHDYSLNVVAGSFLISHIGGKTLTGLIYLSLWRRR